MYIIKNALVSISRNKGRNILIGIIAIVISCAASIALAIKNSATALISSYENQYDVTATIGINRENMKDQMHMDRDATDSERENQKNNMNNIFEEASNIAIEDIENYGNSSYVKSYYYQVSVGVNAQDIEKVSTTTNTNDNQMMRPKDNFQNISSSDFTLVGYSSLSAMEEFINGKYSITEGAISSDLESNTCVINSELATNNNLSVNDEITLVDPNNENNTITLTITGIYDEKTDTSAAMGMFTTSANMIITNTTVVNTLTTTDSEMKKTITPTFILTDKESIDKFEEELKEKGLSEYLTVQTNLDQVEGATNTISNVNIFATTFLIITLIIGGIVLIIINMINIRERRYEIGVLRTIGMKKSLLTFQFLSELVIVSFLGLLIGASLGSLASIPVSNHLLESEISSSKEQRENINNNFSKPMDNNDNRLDHINGITNIEAFDSINAVVDLKVLGELLVIGLGLTLVSSISSMISIQKFSPLTILKERS